MPSEPPSALLDRVRKLLAKAEAEGVTPQEAEALTAKAAELMARYGIDRARLAASRPDTDRPGSRVIDIENPWAQVRAHGPEQRPVDAVAGHQLGGLRGQRLGLVRRTALILGLRQQLANPVKQLILHWETSTIEAFELSA